jgi:hypothetical protein
MSTITTRPTPTLRTRGHICACMRDDWWEQTFPFARGQPFVWLTFRDNLCNVMRLFSLYEKEEKAREKTLFSYSLRLTAVCGKSSRVTKLMPPLCNMPCDMVLISSSRSDRQWISLVVLRARDTRDIVNLPFSFEWPCICMSFIRPRVKLVFHKDWRPAIFW